MIDLTLLETEEKEGGGRSAPTQRIPVKNEWVEILIIFVYS